MKSHTPAVNESPRVDAGEEARQVLVVDPRSGLRRPIIGLQEVDEFIYVTAGKIVRKSLRDELVNQLGDAVQHGTVW